jgi:peptide/nickel transport system substrate-binding protein
MGRHRSWLVMGIAVLAVLVTACGSSDKEESKGASPAATQGGQAAATQTSSGTQQAANIRRGGTMFVAMANNPKVFDPMFANDVESGYVTANIYDALYQYDEDYKPVPYLAEKVTNPDDMTWVFAIRQGVKFHDGTDVDAEAVKFSMDRIRNNKASARFGDTKQITDTVVMDKYTLKVTLSEPFAPFPARLTGGLGYVVSPTAVKTLGEEKFGLNPVGSGPFKFGEWKNDSYVRVEKNPTYWRMGADGKAQPYLDRIEWKIIVESTARLTALQAGDVDMTPNVRDPDLPIIAADPNLQYKERAGIGFGGIWLTINRPPFDNKALRQAVAYAIDKDEIIKTVYEGHRERATFVIPPAFTWARDTSFDPYKHDKEKAKAKLAEGGKPSGFEFEYLSPAGDSQGRLLADLIQAQLAKVNIKMTIVEGDFNGVVIPKLQKMEGNAYPLGLTGSLDPDGSVSGPFEKGGNFNFFPYDNPKVDELIKKGRSTLKIEDRAPIYKEITRLVLEDSPYIFTVHNISRFVGNKKVEGWFIGSKVTQGYAEYWKSKD